MKIIFLIFFTLLFFVSCNLEKKQVNYIGKELSEMNDRLCKSWNTWNTRSVLSHVLLPECFAINLALKDQSGNVLEETLIGRDHFGSKERVIAGPHAYDGSYTELEVEWHNIKLRVQSAALKNELFLLISPLKSMPRDTLVIEPRVLWDRKAEIKIDQNVIIGQTQSSTIKVYINENKPTTTSTYRLSQY